MIKVYALLPKRPDISEERFHEHWSTIHREHALRIDRLRRYVQAHRVEPPVPGLEPAPYDGVPEVWYDSLESAAGQDEDPNYTEYAQKDEPNFVDMSGIRWVMTRHRPLHVTTPLDEGTPVAKVLLMVRRPEGTDVAAFQDAWWQLAEQLAGIGDGLLRTAAAATLPETYGGEAEPTYDGFAELWWPDRAALDAAWAATGEALLGAVGEVADLGRSHAFTCEELRVIWPGDDVPEPAGATA